MCTSTEILPVTTWSTRHAFRKLSNVTTDAQPDLWKQHMHQCANCHGKWWKKMK